jgi:peptidoglycan-associated lipoprotein
MFSPRFDSSARILAFVAISFLTACGGKKVAETPPPTPPSPAPAQAAAEPAKPAVVEPPRPAVAPAPQPVQINLRDVFFNFDDAAIRSDQAPATQNDAAFLSQNSKDNVIIEGHCDDRGSAIYNLALGDRRANTVKEALVRQGVDASRIKTVSYGKEKPVCTDENEQCWQQNRRGHVAVQR